MPSARRAATRRSAKSSGRAPALAADTTDSEHDRDLRRARQVELAHDLGNSLGAVALHIQVLATESPEAREHVDAALRQVRAASAQLMELRQLIRESIK